MKLSPAHAAWALADELARRATASPASFVPWLPNQYSFLASHAKAKEIRQGNQWGGKTWAAIAEVVGRCTGVHPLAKYGHQYPRPHAHFEAWIICDSWSQSVAIMGKVWELLPKDLIDSRTVFDDATGFRGKNPFVRFKNGAILRFKTAHQNPKSLASGTIDVALFDEPPHDERTYTEVQKRLQHRGGVLLLSYTPVNAPVGHLKDKVAEGLIEDHWSALTPEALIPVGRKIAIRGHDGVLRDAKWIAETRRTTSPVEAPVVLDGEWEFRTKGAYFEGAWNPLRLIHPNPPRGVVWRVLGIDHGDAPGKQCAVLMAVWVSAAGEPPSVYVLDEYADVAGTASPADDARAILAMLARHGMAWKDLDYVFGDRVHLPGSGRQKSNRDLAAQIAKLIKVPLEAMRPPVRTVKRGEGRGAGSLRVGSRWLYHAMVAGRFGVHPRCRKVIESAPKYTVDENAWKDIFDAIRYGLDQWIFGATAHDQAPVELAVR